MEQQIERSKVVVRWIVGVALFVGVAYLKDKGQLPLSWGTVLGLTGALAVLNLTYWGILRTGAPRWLKYVTTATDLVLISILVFFTGGAASVFYFTYFIVLVSNSIRYGMGLAIYVATVFNLAYVAVLSWQPPGNDLTVEAVKILTFWGVALYAGYLAMRSQRQARIMEGYEETIARLHAELAALKPQTK